MSNLRAGGWAFFRFIQCLRGPALRRISPPGSESEGQAYKPNKLEKYADNVISTINFAWSMAVHISPVYFVYYAARYGPNALITLLWSLTRNFSFVPVTFVLAYFVRGIGRYRNNKYHEFLRALNTARSLTTSIGPEEERRTGISQYDFKVSALPVTFKHSESVVKPRRMSSTLRKSFLGKLQHFPLSSLRYVAAHMVGRRLIYPGSLAVINLAVAEPLSIGRTKLRKRHNGFRVRLQAADGNTIDCMFMDKRGSSGVGGAGSKIVVCCEGNAAFYELGICEIALSHGYSVLGWNHPGFGDSTGLPFPSQEFNAIDVVIRYVVTRLGFAFSDIILFAWSIGGYSASCAAMSYPEIGAVVIDASFDELYPLVQARVHPFLHEFSRGMVEEYYDLNIAEQLCRYPGPVRIIRRMRDEMMSSNKDAETNRGNHLLIKILQNRYPNIVTEQTLPELWEWLKAPTIEEQSLITSGLRWQDFGSLLRSYKIDKGACYPWTLGNAMSLRDKKALALFLADNYMTHVESTHCVPLPAEYLVIPTNQNL